METLENEGETYWFSNFAQADEPARGALEAVDGAANRQRLLTLHPDDPPEVSRILQAVTGPIGAYAVYDMMALPFWADAFKLVLRIANAVPPLKPRMFGAAISQ